MAWPLTSISMAAPPPSYAPGSGRQKKAILIGIDGVQYANLLELDTPHIDRLNLLQGFTGGDRNGASEQPTKSGPGWATILTGVWANKHRIFANRDLSASTAHPSLFRGLAASGHKTAALVSWPNIIRDYFAHDLALMAHHYYPEAKYETLEDRCTQDGALARMFGRVQRVYNQDFTFMHLDHPDAVGDSLGFGEEYTASIQAADRHLGILLETIEARKNEDWLIIVVTDHGRSPNDGGVSHGEQTEQEREIWIACNKPIRTPAQAALGKASLADIAPTVYNFFGVGGGLRDLDGLSLLDDKSNMN